jgi:hypothetical protein
MSFLTKKAIELLEILGDRNLLYSFLPILVQWYGVIAPIIIFYVAISWCMITLPKTISKQLDLSFGNFA